MVATWKHCLFYSFNSVFCLLAFSLVVIICCNLLLTTVVWFLCLWSGVDCVTTAFTWAVIEPEHTKPQWASVILQHLTLFGIKFLSDKPLMWRLRLRSHYILQEGDIFSAATSEILEEEHIYYRTTEAHMAHHVQYSCIPSLRQLPTHLGLDCSWLSPVPSLIS